MGVRIAAVPACLPPVAELRNREVVHVRDAAAHLGQVDQGFAVQAPHHLDRVPARRHGDLVLAARIEIVPDVRAQLFRHGPNCVFGKERLTTVKQSYPHLGRNRVAHCIGELSLDNPRHAGVRFLAAEQVKRHEQRTTAQHRDAVQDFAPARMAMMSHQRPSFRRSGLRATTWQMVSEEYSLWDVNPIMLVAVKRALRYHATRRPGFRA